MNKIGLVLMQVLLLAASPAGADTLSRIAFGSCANQDLPQPIWNAIVARQPELFVFMGDTIYADTTDMHEMRSKYDKLARVEGYRRLNSQAMVEAIWDDHDYGANDIGAEYEQRQASQKIFLDFFNEPADSERRRTDGIYAVREYGPEDQRIQLILLDTRFFRSPWKRSMNPLKRFAPDDNPALTMLGERQWQWLRTQLKTPAKLRLIVSGIQVINDEHSYETWGNFPRERKRLFDLLKDEGTRGVILLSGDRHFAEIDSIDVGLGYPLIEVTASGLTHSWPGGPDTVNSHRLGAFGGLNFGSLEIDWSLPDPTIAIRVLDVNGEVQLHHDLTLGALGHP